MDIDRMKAALAAFIRQVTSRIDYLALYPSTVISQNQDGTLELEPDTKALGPGLSRVPIRLGLPGAEIKVKPRSRVLLAFEGGDPQQPVATLWEQGGLDELVITAETKVVVNAPNVWLGEEDGDAQPVARLGDVVEVLFPEPVPGAPNISGFITEPPNGFNGTLTITDSLIGIITTAGKKTRAA